MIGAARGRPALRRSTKRSRPHEPQIICSLGLRQPTRCEERRPRCSSTARALGNACRRSTSRSLFVEELGWDKHHGHADSRGRRRDPRR